MALNIEISANGQKFSTVAGASLIQFLQTRGFTPGQVVVEYNGQPLTPAEVQTITLAAGDQLEVVQIVAGG